ncbi:hypothetical protein [Bradyrhizobium sp. 5.13L]
MNSPRPIAAAAMATVNAIVDLASIGLFLTAVYVIAGLAVGRI